MKESLLIHIVTGQSAVNLNKSKYIRWNSIVHASNITKNRPVNIIEGLRNLMRRLGGNYEN